MTGKTRAIVGVVALAASVVGATFLLRPSDSTQAVRAPVGSDLHAVAQQGDRVFLSGHDAAFYSDSPGTWTPISTLAGKDGMVWAVSNTDIIVGGHEGGFRSTDHGQTFSPLTGLPATDVHAVGAAGSVAFLASPTDGLFRSVDNGTTWKSVSPSAQSLIGNLLVDPTDPKHLFAADTAQGVMESRDGGATWNVLGGIETPTGLNWNPANHQQMVARGPDGVSYSPDGGASWLAVAEPKGTAAVAFDPSGQLLAATFDGTNGNVFSSSDLGKTWVPRG